MDTYICSIGVAVATLVAICDVEVDITIGLVVLVGLCQVQVMSASMLESGAHNKYHT